MQNKHISYLSLYKTIVGSVLLWVYAGLLVFTWYLARQTPEEAVLIRIVASILSDIAWFPLGIVAWAHIAAWYPGVVNRTMHSTKYFLIQIIGGTAAVFFVLFFPETSFRFLFLPLIVLTAQILQKLIKSHVRVSTFSWFLPALLVIILTAAHYNWQLLPSVGYHTQDNSIKIMTYNILGNADVLNRQNVIETIRHEQPDVVCCTEYNPRNDNGVFKRMLGDLYPYIISNRDDTSWRTGELILSRFPCNIIPTHSTTPLNAINVQIDIKGVKVDVVTVHLTRVGQHLERAADSPNELMETVNKVSEFEMLKDKMKYSQAQELLEMLTQIQNPIILCGDFNDTPNSKVCHLFSRNYINTFSSAGWGLGGTFGESWMREKLKDIPLFSFLAEDMLRIDHIFVSRHFDIISSKVVTSASGSDHKPVIAEVKIKSTD